MATALLDLWRRLCLLRKYHVLKGYAMWRGTSIGKVIGRKNSRGYRQKQEIRTFNPSNSSKWNAYANMETQEILESSTYHIVKYHLCPWKKLYVYLEQWQSLEALSRFLF
jgi:hypothetical protein